MRNLVMDRAAPQPVIAKPLEPALEMGMGSDLGTGPERGMGSDLGVEADKRRAGDSKRSPD
jgi:hypothetical protein